MTSESRLHPFWVHTLIACGLFLVPPWPLLQTSYVTCVLVYYGVRAGARVLLAGRTHPWFRTTCFLLGAFGMSTTSSVAFMAYDPRLSEGPVLILCFQFLLITAVGVPIWFALLQLLRLPTAFFRWRRRREDQIGHARMTEEAERRADERREQEKEVAREHASNQRRRTEARARCELAYSLHAGDIGERFPKSMFDAFLQTYLSDTHDPDDVERRGRELEGIIDQHRQKVKPEKRPRTIQQLAEWYVHEKQRIESLPLDEELKQEHAAALDMRYAELTQELLQRIEP